MPVTNPIVAENLLPGNPMSEWGITGPGSTNIEGYTTDISATLGGTVDFKINTDSSHYKIDIYRLGYYGGDGARLVGSIDHSGANAAQPGAIVDSTTGLVDAGNWSVTDSWSVPPDAVSGVYLAKLTREDGTGGTNWIPFIVRDDGRQSDMVFQTSDTTWQAYNPWGGHSLYDGTSTAVSYNRPFTTWSGPSPAGHWNFLFGAEYPAIYWMEKNGYDVSYISGLDTARNGNELLNHKVFLSVGHDEYWSGDQRANVEAARDAGVNLTFMSGNECYWKTRWAPSIDGSDTANRTLVCYKTDQSGQNDPSGQWTGTWRAGGSPENALTGQMYMVNSDPLSTDTITYDQSQFALWRNTSVANTAPGGTASLGGSYIGYEWDVDVHNSTRPAGQINLTSTPLFSDSILQGSAGAEGPGTAVHSVTMYRASSGAQVFNAGTIFWTWGLDENHPIGPTNSNSVPADLNVQQLMVNVFANMDVQPGSLQSSLIPGVRSTDAESPDSAADSVLTIAPVFTGQTVTISGTSSDFGGGTTAAVEVSTDGGQTWHPANGYSNWTYDWTVPLQEGTYTILTRAVDDSLNIENPGTGIILNAIGFSASEYLSANLDVAAAGVDPYEHYLQYGWTEGRDPSSGFSNSLYLAHNQDVAAEGIDPLSHYMEYGAAEGRPIYAVVGPSIEPDGFDAVYYALQNQDVVDAGLDLYQHFHQYGWQEGRNPNAYFDTSWYLATYSDVAAAGVDPLEDYHNAGWLLGRDPSSRFSSNAYLAINTDVAAAGLDPLVHFLEHGAHELRTL
jgi:hypothetical protein